MKLSKSLCLLPLLVASAFGQTPPAAPAPAPWSVGGVDFGGLVDGYYSFNFAHPASGDNGLRNFDFKANQFSLNMVKLSASHDADPVGFRVDFGFGKAFDVINGGDPAGGGNNYLEQAYLTLKPSKGNGLTFDFGKFVTSAGAELIETHTNFNYSRSLLFAWTIPYYHFGARVQKPFGNWTGGIQLVNGWNNVEDNNSGKTIGLTSAYVTPKVSHYMTYYVGKEGATNPELGTRHLFDTVLSATPSDKAALYINLDYGLDKNKVTRKGASWYGIGGAVKLSPTDWFAVSPRLEYFIDDKGFSTGTIQKVKEFTFTTELKHSKGFLTRLEYRRDWSDKPFFDRGNELGSSKSQNTILVGLVAYFGK
jgi:hypothetical protein